ncbi:hypothetical protein BD414DRAFT_497167 [Trametes punicea]|nr:hypothetical protein BD414DRAFT_497167 [Trametes punicea]
MRTVDHAVETLYRPFIPPPLKHLAYAALADLFKFLPASKEKPQAIDIRQKLQIASWMSLWRIEMEKKSAFGLSHALEHNLGARYDIPHGITSCLTLAPVVALKAQSLSHEDKEWLAGALYYLCKPHTGSVEDDVLALSMDIQRCTWGSLLYCVTRRFDTHSDSLVDDLGLHSMLSEYHMPMEELPKIAEMSVEESSLDEPLLQKVVALLESIYS